MTLENVPGRFAVDVRSHILRKILLEKRYEPEIVSIILKHLDPSKDAINVGANIGLYANLLASNIQSNCKVLAVEPTPSAFSFLKGNLERNGNTSKVILFNGIATNAAGNYNINIVPGNEEYSSLGEMAHSGVVNKDFITVEVQGDTIDNLVSKNGLDPGVIVIDVEGAEFHVLKGAVETLKKFHPIIITELDDNLLSKQDSDSLQVLEFLVKMNYRVTNSEDKKISYPFMGNVVAEFMGRLEEVKNR